MVWCAVANKNKAEKECSMYVCKIAPTHFHTNISQLRSYREKMTFLTCDQGLDLANPPPPLCDIPSGCCFFTGPWTVTRSSLRMLRRVAAFCRPLRPVLLLVLFARSQSPVVGVLGLCWMWHGVPFARPRGPVVGIWRLCWLLWGSFDCFCCPHTSVLRPSTTCLFVFPCA